MWSPDPALGPQVGGLKHCLMWGPTGGGGGETGGRQGVRGGGEGVGRGIKGKVEVLEVGERCWQRDEGHLEVEMGGILFIGTLHSTT